MHITVMLSVKGKDIFCPAVSQKSISHASVLRNQPKDTLNPREEERQKGGIGSRGPGEAEDSGGRGPRDGGETRQAEALGGIFLRR